MHEYTDAVSKAHDTTREKQAELSQVTDQIKAVLNNQLDALLNWTPPNPSQDDLNVRLDELDTMSSLFDDLIDVLDGIKSKVVPANADIQRCKARLMELRDEVSRAFQDETYYLSVEEMNREGAAEVAPMLEKGRQEQEKQNRQ